MTRTTPALVLALLAFAAAAHAQGEKVLVATITPDAVGHGAVTELLWVDGELVIQVAAPTTSGLRADYYAMPGPTTTLRRLTAPPPAADAAWRRKASRRGPNGLGEIVIREDTTAPMQGIGSLERRIGEAVTMGGTQTAYAARLGGLLLYEGAGRVPYDGEKWGWSTPEINRLAWIDKAGDLWTAGADGRGARRELRGTFALPAWSDDGRQIAVLEVDDRRRQWRVYVVALKNPH